MESALKIVKPRPPKRASRPRRLVDSAALGVVAQVRTALKPHNRLATVLGAALGGFIPLASFTVSHNEVKSLWSLPALLVLGGLVYSAKTVYAWGKMAFASGAKALGFTVLVEGVMTCSGVPWLSHTALGYLIAINAVATGCTLALPPRAPALAEEF
jgi:hypothetical protein